MSLGAVLAVAFLFSIADSLLTDYERCPKCGHRMRVTGPYGVPTVRMYRIDCEWCGHGFTRFPDDETG